MDTRTAVQNAMFTNALLAVAKSAFDDDKQGLVKTLDDDVQEWGHALKHHQQNAFEKGCERVAMIFVDLTYNAQTGQNSTVKLCALLFMCMQTLPVEKTDRLCDAVAEISEIMFEQHGEVWSGLCEANALEKPFRKAVTSMKEMGYFQDVVAETLFADLFENEEAA